VIIGGPTSSIQAEDFLGPREDTWVTITASGLISRTYEDSAPRITGEVKDPPLAMMASNTTHTLYLFTADGQAATIPVKVLQQAENPEQGVLYTTLCTLRKEDEITYALSLPPGLETGYLVTLTEQGEVKRLRMEDLPGMSSNAFKYMDIEKDDRLLWIGHVTDESEIILVTYQGQAIRFKVSDVRPTGLGAGGMRAIKLMGQRDRVIGGGIVEERVNLWVCTDTGVGKRTPIAEYPTQGRAGSGVITMKLPKDAGGLTTATVGRVDDHIILVTSKGKPKYMQISAAPQAGRNTKGDYVISLGAKEVAARVVKLMDRIEVPDAVPGEVGEEIEIAE
jgi:DNA gyrase subunit A